MAHVGCIRLCTRSKIIAVYAGRLGRPRGPFSPTGAAGISKVGPGSSSPFAETNAGEIRVILIGMPGLEKKLARYPQFYSRIGFVHEFRPLDAAAIRQLLQGGWMRPGVHLPPQPWAQDTVAAIIRITGGNFRLLNRLLTQMERILEINSLQEVTKAVADAARESLDIGQS